MTAINNALSVALGMVKSGEKLSISKIAQQAGCNRTYLYSSKEFMNAINEWKKLYAELPAGDKSEDGSIEAYDRQGPRHRRRGGVRHDNDD
jgi:hypothetical protein